MVNPGDAGGVAYRPLDTDPALPSGRYHRLWSSGGSCPTPRWRLGGLAAVDASQPDLPDPHWILPPGGWSSSVFGGGLEYLNLIPDEAVESIKIAGVRGRDG